MQISVIVPTYKRSVTLLQSLRSLQRQTWHDFEIIVVDNAADPEVERAVTEFARIHGPVVRYVPELQLGLHNARHAGALAATGDALVFTDDDATFDPGWLQAYAMAFAEHPGMAAAGGPVRPVWEIPPPRWLREYMGQSRMFWMLSLMEPYREFRLDRKGYFFGVNMAIRRSVLFEVGGFNPEAFGNIWLGDGETGLLRKLQARSMLVGYVPEAVVYHHIPRSRMTVDYLCLRVANDAAATEYSRFHPGIPRSAALGLRMARVGLSLARLVLVTPARVAIKRDRFALLKWRLGMADGLSRLHYLVRLSYDSQFRNLVMKENWLELARSAG